MVDAYKLKMFIRDKAELNFLLNNKEQFDEEEILQFDKAVRDEIAILYPALSSKVKTLPDVVVIYGVISKLMEAEASKQNRNQMTINDDNVGSIDYETKASQYMSFANTYSQKMHALLSRMCESSFVNDFWGEVGLISSEFEFYNWS